jgi:hypothetical protein
MLGDGGFMTTDEIVIVIDGEIARLLKAKELDGCRRSHKARTWPPCGDVRAEEGCQLESGSGGQARERHDPERRSSSKDCGSTEGALGEVQASREEGRARICSISQEVRCREASRVKTLLSADLCSCTAEVSINLSDPLVGLDKGLIVSAQQTIHLGRNVCGFEIRKVPKGCQNIEAVLGGLRLLVGRSPRYQFLI